MGLSNPLIIEALIRERTYRPFAGDIVLIGRQTVYFTPLEILALLRQHSVDVRGVNESDIEIDRSTLNRANSDAQLITDRALLQLLGASGRIAAMDHSDYEGAELIHDLTKPVPDGLRDRADLIIDGSTLDNVFNPAMALENFAKMLRPGGRLLTANMYSNHSQPYAMMTPLWYLDYFVVNGFVDCKVYIQVGTSPYNTFTIDTNSLLDPTRAVSPFVSPHEMAIIVLAEKGKHSTCNVSPAQQHYRSQEQWTQYRENLQQMQLSPRPHICRSQGDIVFFDVAGGHLFMDTNWNAQDPLTEIRKVYPKFR
jgi:SAM-dependent methyltransferase